MVAEHIPAIKAIILEAGVFSFFVRGRVVSVDEPSHDVNTIDDIARSFILLRPIVQATDIVKGVLANENVARVLILPKKVLPSQGKRFMTFVAQANVSEDDIRSQLATSFDYSTKTANSRHTPAATQVCEGVYALSSTPDGRTSHFIYNISQPRTLGRFEREILGLEERGSLIMCTKNPDFANRAGVELPAKPNFSKEVMNAFRSLRWLPTIPSHLDHVNAQVLLIGERPFCDEGTESHDTDQDMEVKLEEVDDFDS